jgi:polyisoprenoid-binding protein YceI
MAKFKLPIVRLIQKVIFQVFVLFVFTACGSANGGAEDTPLPQGMPFDAASTIYVLNPNSTEARFLIGEILLGEPKTVFGKTNQVSGEFAFDLENLSMAAVGPIQVDARTLLTDDGFRNRAIETRILLSRVFQYITFTPTAVSGLPDAAIIGEPLDFQITGDLTITEYTKPVVFDVKAVAVSDTRIEGNASATIQRADFNLVVPSATGVAGVDEEVVLELDFTADAAQ